MDYYDCIIRLAEINAARFDKKEPKVESCSFRETNILKYKTKTSTSTLEIPNDGRHIAVFEDGERVFKCTIESLWDMLRENLINVEIKDGDYSLMRRKKEALAAKIVTVDSRLDFLRDRINGRNKSSGE